MVSLWGSKKDGDGSAADPPRDPEDDRRPISRGEYERREDEADERTRLLPRRPPPPHSDGYLDPDDPAVSPYNLWSVRFLRYLTIIFLLITFLWWILLLVSIFVSPPYLYTRGSGFFDFSYTTLTFGNLLVTLLFFSSPSKAMRICTWITAGLLLTDMVIILVVPRIRLEEGWVGIASVVWAALIAAFCALSDKVVAWGKAEEEQRLTGRAETRRTLKEWTAVLIATIILVLYNIIVLLMTLTLILRAIDARVPMAGHRYLVDGDKYAVHLACIGNRTLALADDGKPAPTMLLEAGERPSEYDFEHWAYEMYNANVVPRYCYWDRPGYAWSDNAPSPHSAGMSSDALSEALTKAGEEGPFVLVAAGTGALVSRIFASRHAGAVKGIMLVDAWHEDLLHRLGSPGRGFALWGWGILSPLGVDRLLGAVFQGRTARDRVYGRSAHQGGKFIKAQLQENLVIDSISKNEVVTARAIQDPDVPLAVVSSGEMCARDRGWERKQEDLTKLTERLVGWEVVKGAPHRVWTMKDEGRRALTRNLKRVLMAVEEGDEE